MGLFYYIILSLSLHKSERKWLTKYNVEYVIEYVYRMLEYSKSL
jgi:hypothetical protein